MKKVLIIIGRFNPPTIAHQWLFNYAEKYAEENGYELIILPTKSNDERNPLPYKYKLKCLRKLSIHILNRKNIKNGFQLLEILKKKKYNEIIGIGGSDRKSMFDAMGIKSIIIERNDSYRGQISATRVRKLVLMNDDTFKQYLPNCLNKKYIAKLIRCFVPTN